MPSCFKITNIKSERLEEISSDIKRHFGHNIRPIIKDENIFMFSEGEITNPYLEHIIKEIRLADEKVTLIDCEITYCIAVGNTDKMTVEDVIDNVNSYKKIKFYRTAEQAEKVLNSLPEIPNNNAIVLLRIIKEFEKENGFSTFNANTISEDIVKIHLNFNEQV